MSAFDFLVVLLFLVAAVIGSSFGEAEVGDDGICSKVGTTAKCSGLCSSRLGRWKISTIVLTGPVADWSCLEAFPYIEVSSASAFHYVFLLSEKQDQSLELNQKNLRERITGLIFPRLHLFVCRR
jgi:hypothetical protein